MRVMIEPVAGVRGRARLSVWILDATAGHGDAWIEWNHDEIPTNPSHPWTRSVCRHFAETGGSELSASYLLSVVRNAQQAEFAKGWRS